MSSVILAVVEHPEIAIHTLTAAGHLAELMGGARINVLAIRVPPEVTILPSEEVLTPEQDRRIRARERQRVAALRAQFDTWAATAQTDHVAIEWFDVETPADAAVGEWGRRSDFVVLSRLTRHDQVPERLALHAALFDTDRPVLVVPPSPTRAIGQCVAIAWRDDKRTVRSLLAALRLLTAANEVHVLAGMRQDSPPPRVPDILIEHGVNAQLHVLPIGAGVFGEALLAEAHALGADLLVMGAFVHHPLRTLILGGVTRYMLAHADVPVLMRH